MSDLVVTRATLTREGQTVRVRLDTPKHTIPTRDALIMYRKSWSMKKYVDRAMSDLDACPGPFMSYSWNMS